MAYVWDYIAIYPVESAVIIGIIAFVYVGWLKKFWYIHKPSLYTTKMGEWRIKRFIGRIVEFETEQGSKIMTEQWAKLEKNTAVFVRIYISGQPIRRLKLVNSDIYSITRNPSKLFKKEITMNKKNMFWISEKNHYEFTDEENEIYIIKPIIFEKAMVKKIDNMDIKSTRGSKVSPALVHSGYFSNHLPIPPDEYEESDKSLQITPYAYQSKDSGSYGTYTDLLEDYVKDEEDKDDKTPIEEDSEV
ncbi:hypothetical protein KAU43_07675 [candidate division WOR-3 bacterium]|nr:hypothetical protein [candidate division WOR-3 bacterium]